MALKAIFAELAARMPEQTLLAPDKFDEHAAPPLILWQPVSATHLAARRFGGGAGDDGDIATRSWVIQVEVWATDLDALEVMVDRFLAVAHDVLSRNGYRGSTEQWFPGGVTAKGAICRLAFSLQTPIRRTPTASRPITAIATNVTITEQTP